MTTLGAELPQRLQRHRRAPPRPKPIRTRQKIRLEDGFQHQLHRHLRHPVPNRRDPQRPLPSIGLRYVPRRTTLGRYSPARNSAPSSSRKRSTPYARRRGSTGRRFPRCRGCVSLASTLPEGRHSSRLGHTAREAPTRCPLGCGTQPALQFSHFVARPTAAGVVRSGPAGHSLALTCSSGVTTPGTLPSVRVVRHDHRRYYDPSDSRCAALDFAFGLYEPPCRDDGCADGSLVFRTSLARVLRPLPRRDRRRAPVQRRRCCLRRDMSGSAPGLFLCRGCRLHFMLRPACLLPAARLSPPDGLSTPRSGAGVSPGRLGPATRRSDAYRDGTLTRWRSAASGRAHPSPKGQKRPSRHDAPWNQRSSQRRPGQGAGQARRSRRWIDAARNRLEHADVRLVCLPERQPALLAVLDGDHLAQVQHLIAPAHHDAGLG